MPRFCVLSNGRTASRARVMVAKGPSFSRGSASLPDQWSFPRSETKKSALALPAAPDPGVAAKASAAQSAVQRIPIALSRKYAVPTEANEGNNDAKQEQKPTFATLG